MSPLRAFDPSRSWAALPKRKQAEIGSLVLAWAFADYVSRPSHHDGGSVAEEAIRDEAMRDCDRLFPELLELIPASLPEVFHDPIRRESG